MRQSIPGTQILIIVIEQYFGHLFDIALHTRGARYLIDAVNFLLVAEIFLDGYALLELFVENILGQLQLLQLKPLSSLHKLLPIIEKLVDLLFVLGYELPQHKARQKIYVPNLLIFLSVLIQLLGKRLIHHGLTFDDVLIDDLVEVVCQVLLPILLRRVLEVLPFIEIDHLLCLYFVGESFEDLH